MTQFQVRNDKGRNVIYGFDRASGYFVQVRKRSGEADLARSSVQDGLTGSELVRIVEENGVTLPEEHLLCAMLDLPFGEWNPLLVGQ
jgi:hypothetical protein